jgi:hypothetical protein
MEYVPADKPLKENAPAASLLVFTSTAGPVSSSDAPDTGACVVAFVTVPVTLEAPAGADCAMTRVKKTHKMTAATKNDARIITSGDLLLRIAVIRAFER